jgi:trimeric autotransporter adhesin
MKYSTIIFAFILMYLPALSQVPQKLSYQAVIRNNTQQPVINREVGIRISILEGSPDGNEIYREIYNPNPRTNDHGVVHLDIGNGIALKGIFQQIDWSKGPYFIKTETDPSGGTTYSVIGTSQLLSVPYALYAKTAENVMNMPVVPNDISQLSDNDKLLFDGNWESLKNKPSKTISYPIASLSYTSGNVITPMLT